MKKKDLRFIKNEKLIIDSFLSLADEYPFSEIHTKDICSEAMISRNTFYAHYEDKYQLMEQIYRNVEKNMLAGLTPEIISGLETNTIYASSEWCMRTIYENRKILRPLAKCTPERFREMIRNVFIDATMKTVYDDVSPIENDTKLKMARAYISDSLTSIIFIWLQDMNRMKTKEVTDLLYRISHEAVSEFYKYMDEAGVRRKSSFAGRSS